MTDLQVCRIAFGAWHSPGDPEPATLLSDLHQLETFSRAV
jgi:hypothetical protein